MNLESRPTEMLERQLAANRHAARDQRHHAHIDRYRPHFVREILAIRAELRRRLAYQTGDGRRFATMRAATRHAGFIARCSGLIIAVERVA
jgi:hypothetical protein